MATKNQVDLCILQARIVRRRALLALLEFRLRLQGVRRSLDELKMTISRTRELRNATKAACAGITARCPVVAGEARGQAQEIYK